MAGELTIQQNTDGTATINFEGGGSHTVGQAGDNVADNVAALQSAYGDRVGNVISSELTGETQISNAQSVAGSPTNATTTNNIPAWVDPNYSYDPANPRKPNMREMMQSIGGKPLEEMTSEEYAKIASQASSILYGVVGSNTDTRDWNAITAASTDPTTGKIDGNKWVAATQIATSQMYGGTTVAYQPGG